jgi:cobalt-zinc-cadmium efflux system outer membrane protein
MASVFQDFDAARATAQQYSREMLPRAEQAYKLYQTNYQAMAGAYPQVLISQRTLFQLQAEYVQALDAVWQGAFAIRGFGLMDGLSGPMVGPTGWANQPRGLSGSGATGAAAPRPASMQ